MMVCKWWLTRFSFCNLNGSDAQGPLITLGRGGYHERHSAPVHSHSIIHAECLPVNIQISRNFGHS